MHLLFGNLKQRYGPSFCKSAAVFLTNSHQIVFHSLNDIRASMFFKLISFVSAHSICVLFNWSNQPVFKIANKVVLGANLDANIIMQPCVRLY